jgi:fibronectin type 3 domain-containing protein
MIGRKQLKRWLSAASVALLALGLAACGTDATPSTKVTATGSVSTLTGTTASKLVVASPTAVTLSIPTLTTMTDAVGTPVTGSIDTTVAYATAVADLPPAARTLPTGATLAAFADITLGTVKSFSQPVALTINVPVTSATTGDALTVYNFNSTTGTWTYAGTEIVDASGNISPTVTHLSIWGVFKSIAPPPVKPAGVAAVAGDAQATVSWSAVTGATSYKIYYGTAAGVTASSATFVASAVTPQIVTGLNNFTPYYFVVTALNAAGESIVSSEVSATPLLPPPAKPATIIVSGGDSQAILSWATATDATSYNVYYMASTTTLTSDQVRAGGTPLINVTTPYTLAGLTNGITYDIVVVALNAGGESATSSVKTVTPAVALQPPGTPSGVTVTSPSVGQVHVAWAAVSLADSYNIYYLASASQPTNAQVLAGTVVTSTTTFKDLTLTSGVKYYFLIKAVNAAGEGTGTQGTAKGITVL